VPGPYSMDLREAVEEQNDRTLAEYAFGAHPVVPE
jgi:hypothetical protein